MLFISYAQRSKGLSLWMKTTFSLKKPHIFLFRGRILPFESQNRGKGFSAIIKAPRRRKKRVPNLTEEISEGFFLLRWNLFQQIKIINTSNFAENPEVSRSNSNLHSLLWLDLHHYAQMDRDLVMGHAFVHSSPSLKHKLILFRMWHYLLRHYNPKKENHSPHFQKCLGDIFCIIES